MLGKHLFGLYEKALSASDDLCTRLSKVKTLGFDFMEMSIDESDARLARLSDTDDQITEIQNCIRKTGVPIRTICLSGHRRFPMGSADPETRRRGREMMEQAIRLADKIGARIIMLAGYDVFYEPSSPQTVQAFLESLRWAAGLAGEYQIMLGVEVMDTELINSLTKYLEWEQKVHSPWFRVYPDMGNLNAWGFDVCDEIHKGARSCVGMHIKDTVWKVRGKPGVFRDIPFGEGSVDFVNCFKAMESSGFSGVCVMEMWDNGCDDMQTVAEAKRFVEQKYRQAMHELAPET